MLYLRGNQILDSCEKWHSAWQLLEYLKDDGMTKYINNDNNYIFNEDFIFFYFNYLFIYVLLLKLCFK